MPRVPKLRSDMLGDASGDSDDDDPSASAFDVFAAKGGGSSEDESSGGDEAGNSPLRPNLESDEVGEALFAEAAAARLDAAAAALPPVSAQKKAAIHAAARAGGATVSAESDDDAGPDEHAEDAGPAADPGKSLMASDSGRYFAVQICKICGAEGHLKVNCPDKNNKPCFLCGVRGHNIADCPNQLCWHCGKPGHLSRSCSDRLKGKAGLAELERKKQQAARSDGARHKRFSSDQEGENEDVLGGWACELPVRGHSKGSLPHFCFNCGEQHRGTDCKEPGADACMGSGPPAGRGSGNGECFVCGKVGHLARDCPDRNARQRRSSAPASMGRGGMRGGTRGGPGRWGAGRFGRGSGNGARPFGRMRGARGPYDDERSMNRDSRDRDRARDRDSRRARASEGGVTITLHSGHSGGRSGRASSASRDKAKQAAAAVRGDTTARSGSADGTHDNSKKNKKKRSSREKKSKDDHAAPQGKKKRRRS